MIKIKQSKTADTRSSDYREVTKKQLMDSSMQHITDVAKGIKFFKDMLDTAALNHDRDKLSNIDGFLKDFSCNFETKEWLENHYSSNRHHLNRDNGVPSDVNLIDVLEMITDCVMASVGRGGKQFPIVIDEKVLRRAFDNTVVLLKNNVELEK